MRMKSIWKLGALAIAALLVAAPMFAAARGSANFSSFVVLGDSYGAGVQSGSLNQNHQPYSWAAILARQVGAPTFVQPLVSYPGIGPELVLNDIISYPPGVAPAPGLGQPLLLTYPAPYNNLAIPGARVGDLTTLTGKEPPAAGTAQTFAQFILRGLGTEVQQAIALKPTFIAIWIGGNDILAGALNGTPAFMTPTATFKTEYNAMLDQLVAGAPNAGIVVGNLPTGANLPVFATVPPFIVNPATRQPVLGPDGKPIYYFGDLGGGQLGQLPVGSEVLLSCSPQLASGFGIPPALAGVPPFSSLPNAGKPLPDSCTLTPAEQAAIVARANEYNQVIADAAAAHNVPVADIHGLFDKFAAQGGYPVGPFTFTPAYIQGGLFSLDGLHMTDIGYALFANQYIRTINQAYGTDVPLFGVWQFLANNGGVFPMTTKSGAVWVDGTPWTFTSEAAQSILQFAPKPHKLRSASH